MTPFPDDAVSPLRHQAANALARARRLPVGPDRNDLRQLAIGLRWLERKAWTADMIKQRHQTGAQSPPDRDPA